MWARRGESIVAGLALAVAVSLFATARSLPRYPGMVSQPGDWPSILAVLMALASAGLLVQVIRAQRQGHPASSEQPEPGAETGSAPPGRETSDDASSEEGHGSPGNFRLLVACLALLFAYVWCLPLLGFWLATPPFLIVYTILLGMRNPFHMGLVALATTAVLILVFAHGVMLPLPRGIGLLREWSFLFY